jgi:hypothetical protein
MGIEEAKKPSNFLNEPQNGYGQAISCYNHSNLIGSSHSWYGIGKYQLGLYIRFFSLLAYHELSLNLA